MKKILFLLLILILSSIFLPSCKRVPRGMSKEVYEYGVEAVEITEAFLQYNLTANAAEIQLEEISDTLEFLSRSSEDSSLYMRVSLLSFSMSSAASEERLYYSVSEDTRDEIAKDLDKLKEKLNL